MQIDFLTNKPEIAGEMAEVFRLFFGEIAIRVNPTDSDDREKRLVLQQHINAGREGWHFALELNEKRDEKDYPFLHGEEDKELLYKRYQKRYAKQQLYEVLKAFTGKVLPWGSLTGIRPTRLVYEEMKQGLSVGKAVDIVAETFDLSTEKKSLLQEVVAFQLTMVAPKNNQVSIYVGIPFCTTRCSYCSFSSGEIGKGELVEPYLQALQQEIKETATLIQQAGLTVRSMYMGGGTPTALSAFQLEQVLSTMHRYFGKTMELTVEAGRPDTIDKEKLSVLKDQEVDRISINPQTMNEKTLALIGRNHSAKETIVAFELARSMGFDHINMDVIAGLPQENIQDFSFTLEQSLLLQPESLTVHSLALKRGTTLWNERKEMRQGQEVAMMTKLAREYCQRAKLLPYYLYRQKYMAENQENVGYAKKGYGCQYNVDMMEETSHVLALGAGGISKRIFEREDRIQRAPNVSNIEHYIHRIDEMIERKKILWK
ncbi:MAG: coproporphyrinogen dehydrogenase HemZ [Clostridiales bacterium]|nr:coproporphyrinogen dehydrogenase HemZ [Clostridiales bacterium]